MRAALIGLLTLAGCSPSTATRDEKGRANSSQEVQARVAYGNCLSAKAAKIQEPSLSVEAVSELAVARCLPQRDTFTIAHIKDLRDPNADALDQSLLKVALDIRDAFERNMLRSVQKEVAGRRGQNWDKGFKPID